jgi:hypothetical protein
MQLGFVFVKKKASAVVGRRARSVDDDKKNDD